MGHQFLSCTRLAVDQNSAIRRRHELNLLPQSLYRNAFAYDDAAGRELFLELAIFLAHLLGIDCILYKDECLIDRQRFFQEVICAELGGAHCSFDRTVAGDHDDLGSILGIPNFL